MNNNLYEEFKKIYLSGTETLDIKDYSFDDNNNLIVNIINKKTGEFRFSLKVKYDEKGEVIWY